MSYTIQVNKQDDNLSVRAFGTLDNIPNGTFYISGHNPAEGNTTRTATLGVSFSDSVSESIVAAANATFVVK